MGDGAGRELAWLDRAPFAAACVVGVSAFLLALAMWAAEPVENHRAVAILVVGGVGAAIAFLKGARATNAARASIALLTRNLNALATNGVEVEARNEEVTRELAEACAELRVRLASADKLAKVDIAEAKDIDEERLAFLADFSHELRTPLNSILGFAHVLDSESEGPLDADGREAVGIMLASGEQLNALVEDLLDLTALETGKLELRVAPVHLSSIVRDVVRGASVLASQKQLEVVIEEDADVMAMADPKRLRRMLWNLATRAVRATDRGPVVLSVKNPTTTDTYRGTAIVSVRDEGRPMSRGEQQALLQGEIEDSASREAIGLGLGVVGRLVRLHGGTLTIATGETGSRVDVALPGALKDEGSQ